MAFIDDLTTADTATAGRVAAATSARYADGTAGYYQNQADIRRQSLLAALRAAATDQTYANQLATAGDAQLALAKSRAGDVFQATDAADLAGGASRGLLGSSTQRRARATAVATKDATVTDAATAVQDWKDQAQQDRQSMLYDYLDKIVNPSRSEAAIQSINLGGQGFSSQLTNASNAVNNQYRASLSEALGSVLSNGVAPTISSGFSSADRLNARGQSQNIASIYGNQAPTARTDYSFFSW